MEQANITTIRNRIDERFGIRKERVIDIGNQVHRIMLGGTVNKSLEKISTSFHEKEELILAGWLCGEFLKMNEAKPKFSVDDHLPITSITQKHIINVISKICIENNSINSLVIATNYFSEPIQLVLAGWYLNDFHED